MSGWSGRCLCGAVTWRMRRAPLWQAHCHCESCRRATASPFTSFIGVRLGTVDWSGERALFASSPGVRRGFCPHCGTPLSYESDAWPDEEHLYAATLDDPALYEPAEHVFWNERVPWCGVADDLPKRGG